MSKGKKYPQEVKENVYALYATIGNIADVAKQLELPESTVATWLKNKPPDKFDELRCQKMQEIIEQAKDTAQEFIKQSDEALILGFRRLIEKLSDPNADIPVNQLSTMIGTIYDKRALAKGDSTQNTKNTIEIILPEGCENYAK